MAVIDFCHYQQTKEVKYMQTEQPVSQLESAHFKLCNTCNNELFLLIDTAKGVVPLCWMCEANKGNM